MNARNTRHFDLAVIGGGSAGYAAARTARDSGLRVAVVEGAPRLGGLCILRGCMPTKTLLHAADVLHGTRHHAAELGLQIPRAGFDWQRIFQRKDRLVDDWADYRSGQLRDEGLHLFRNSARFANRHQLVLDDGSTLSASHFIIATGSRVAPPPLEALEKIGFIDSDHALALAHPPKSLIVLGAGPVALEFAQFFARLDVRVTLIQRSTQLLSSFDPDAAAEIEAVLRREGIEILTGTRLLDAAAVPAGRQITFEHHGEPKTRVADAVFLGTGRRPNTAALALDQAGVETDDSGKILVNERQQSSIPHIFAAGDCCSSHEIVHLAVRQGEIAAHNIAHPDHPQSLDSRLLLRVVFTEPQIAIVGPTEKECQAGATPYLADSHPFAEHGKAEIFGANAGFAKILADPDTGRILGASCVGPLAAELIHELMVAIASGLTVHRFARLPHYHPTLAEIWTYPAENLAARIPLPAIPE